MTLRMRIAAAASVAVALTVVALAATQYVATRSTLRGQIDSALSESAQRFVSGPPDDDRGPPGGGGEAGSGLPPNVPFGGAPGVAQLVASDGTASQPADGAEALPVDARVKEAYLGEG